MFEQTALAQLCDQRIESRVGLLRVIQQAVHGATQRVFLFGGHTIGGERLLRGRRFAGLF